MKRTYTADLPGGTATTAIQLQEKGTVRQALVSVVNAAAGKVEISTSSASQIGTAQPTQDVIARLTIGAAGRTDVVVPMSANVIPFQTIYVHQTGAGNLGSVTLA